MRRNTSSVVRQQKRSQPLGGQRKSQHGGKSEEDEDAERTSSGDALCNGGAEEVEMESGTSPAAARELEEAADCTLPELTAKLKSTGPRIFIFLQGAAAASTLRAQSRDLEQVLEPPLLYVHLCRISGLQGKKPECRYDLVCRAVSVSDQRTKQIDETI